MSANSGQGDRDHLAGRVELHRARAQGDHRVVEGQVTVLQALQVAQHLVLGVVGVEYRMGQDGRRCAAGRSGRRPPRATTWASSAVTSAVAPKGCE